MWLGTTRFARPAAIMTGGLGRHRMLPAHVAYRSVELLARGWPDRVVCATLDLGGGAHALIELDLAIGSCIELFVTPASGMADQASVRLFRVLAATSSTIIDVGANVGYFTYLAAAHAPSARVIAYEPTPALAALIGRNIVRNGWSTRAEVRAAGASASAGTLPFYVLEGDSESTLEADRARNAGMAGRLAIQVVALDDVIESEAIDCATTLLKIDVEGHELRVLDGLARTLRRDAARPTLLMEFLGRAIVEQRVIERVLEMGLAVYYVSRRALVRLASTDDLQSYHELGQWNFLLTARPPADVQRIARSARLAWWTAGNRSFAR
jgi:FkbM family methyltransferase